MSELKETLESIQRRVKDFRTLYERTEMAVRDQIVIPILRALGWNSEDPGEVQPEISTEEGRPDYALIKNGKKKLFIEAKKLSVDIEQKEHMRQLGRYCFSEGTKYGVLTNGIVWLLLRSFEEGTTLAERTVWKVDIESEELLGVIRKLNTISKDNVEQIEISVIKTQILDEIWHSLSEEPKDMVEALVPVFETMINEGYPDYKFEAVEIEDFLSERMREIVLPLGEITIPEGGEIIPPKGERPRKMKIESDTFDMRNSYEILVNSANWLIRKGKLKPTDCPVGIGHKRNLVNKEPKHKYGDEFRAPKKLSNGLWIETHYSTAQCIINARRLLERFGYSGQILQVIS